MGTQAAGRGGAAPPGTFYEVDDARLSRLQSVVERSLARKAMVLAYRTDPPMSTNVAVSVARRLPMEAGGATELSVSALKRADSHLKRIGVVRP